MKLNLLDYVLVLCGLSIIGLIIQQTALISPAVAIVEILAALVGYYIYRKVK